MGLFGIESGILSVFIHCSESGNSTGPAMRTPSQNRCASAGRLRHGEYWSDKSTTPNIARLFGKSTPHALPYDELLPRKLPEPPRLPMWTIPKRNVSEPRA
jgi:hypothetical protein